MQFYSYNVWIRSMLKDQGECGGSLCVSLALRASKRHLARIWWPESGYITFLKAKWKASTCMDMMVCMFTKSEKVQGTSPEELLIKPSSHALARVKASPCGQNSQHRGKKAAFKDPLERSAGPGDKRDPAFLFHLDGYLYRHLIHISDKQTENGVVCVFCWDPPFPEKNEIYYGLGGGCPVKTGVKSRKSEKPHSAFSNFIHIRHLKNLEREGKNKKKIQFSLELLTSLQLSFLGYGSKSWVKPKTRMPDTVSVSISEIGLLMTS